MHLGLGLLPIVPILLLPFILVFFVVVFPLWGVALAIVGALFLLLSGADRLARLAGITVFSSPSRRLFQAFRWVLTFGGLSNRLSERQP